MCVCVVCVYMCTQDGCKILLFNCREKCILLCKELLAFVRISTLCPCREATNSRRPTTIDACGNTASKKKKKCQGDRTMQKKFQEERPPPCKTMRLLHHLTLSTIQGRRLSARCYFLCSASGSGVAGARRPFNKPVRFIVLKQSCSLIY